MLIRHLDILHIHVIYSHIFTCHISCHISVEANYEANLSHGKIGRWFSTWTTHNWLIDCYWIQLQCPSLLTARPAQTHIYASKAERVLELAWSRGRHWHPVREVDSTDRAYQNHQNGDTDSSFLKRKLQSVSTES